MKKISSLLLALFTINSASAQIQKTTIVEHFTNSNCSICASTNPGFYTTLATQPNALHIAFHPSSPYASCVFSQANKPENDARTNYYGIFGGTPKFIVNGGLISVSNANSALTSAAAEMSNYSIQATQEFIGLDSVKVAVIIKKIATDTMTSASLFAGVAEDTVNQTTGNGESIHHDVFRKSLSVISGDIITLPLNVNDSLIKQYGYKISSNWNSTKLNTITILQNTNTKTVIQSNQSVNLNPQMPNAIVGINKVESLIYPNPSNGLIYLKGWEDFTSISILTIDGRVVAKKLVTSSLIDIQSLVQGVYFIQLNGKGKVRYQKITIN